MRAVVVVVVLIPQLPRVATSCPLRQVREVGSGGARARSQRRDQRQARERSAAGPPSFSGDYPPSVATTFLIWQVLDAVEDSVSGEMARIREELSGLHREGKEHASKESEIKAELASFAERLSTKAERCSHLRTL